MKQVEIKFQSTMNELNKLNARLERAQKALEKKRAAAEKLGVADMSNDEHREWLIALRSENGWITDKADIKKNGAWIDLSMAQDTVEEIKHSIELAERKFEKAAEAAEKFREELEKMEDWKAKEALWQKQFEEEQREWAKDGITLERRYAGKTPSGKGFSIERNSGVTLRSRHCFTLYLEGEGVVFTSGEFWRAYGIIKSR